MSDSGEPIPERQRGLSLTQRVVLFLTLALLPLGLIAVIQTREYQREALRRSELALLALTERAASGQDRLIQTALGANRSIALLLPDLAEDPEACSDFFARFTAGNPEFSFAGFVSTEGLIVCGNSGRGIQVSDIAGWEAYRADPQRAVTSVPRGAVSREWVVISREPVFDGDAFVGAATISIPHRLLSRSGQETILDQATRQPLQLITFNASGEVLSRLAGNPDNDDRDLPSGDLARFASGGARAFTDDSRTGVLRSYAVTPIVEGAVFALGVWESELRRNQGLPSWMSVLIFPILMWAMSLLVASVAMQWLVLTHVEKLRQKMRSFGRSRRLPETPPLGSTPPEFREMDAEFMAMAESVMRDEAQLENAVREKNILLKEIHHRVKNNLQLLSSITSMKRRRARSPETQFMLQRLQDRILSLAAIHRNLYLSKDMSLVETERLLHDVSAQFGYTPGQNRVALRIDPISLVPQQAVPLSLFVAEGFALAGEDVTAPVELSLAQDAGGLVQLTMLLPAAGDVADAADATISASLLVAFADQLGGSSTDEETEDGRRRLGLRFRPMEAVQEALDY